MFADVDPATGNLTRESVEAALTPRTKAVILVHQGGIPADANGVRALCEPRGIVVIEDAACAAGSKCQGRPVAAGAAIGGLVVPSAQADHHRRGRHAHHGQRRMGRTGPAVA